MPDASTHLLSLIGLTFLLGLRHGMDPDHLAMVDNLTRYNAQAAPRVARWCGAWFSLGHGVLVMAVAAGLALLSGKHALPHWLETTGQLISASLLVVIGLVNLRQAASPHAHPIALRASLLSRASRVSHPLLISMIGMAFAVSMDTMSQAAIFSMAASGEFAWGTAVLLGAVFTLGMLVADAFGSWWCYSALRSADGQGYMRKLTLAIALLSLAIGALGFARMLLPELSEHYDTYALAIGVTILGITFAAGLIPRAIARLNKGHSRAPAP
jgi:high-affinity nickel-transport protein